MKAPSIEKEFILSSDKPTKPQTVEDTWNNFTHQDMRCDENKCELLVGDNGLTVYVERSKVYSGIIFIKFDINVNCCCFMTLMQKKGV